MLFFIPLFLFWAPIYSQKKTSSLAVLDPINFKNQKVDSISGGFLRSSFSTNPKWKTLTRDTVNARAREYKYDLKIPCYEIQCAFDAGNILSTEYILFGSVTELQNHIAYSMNLMHIPTFQIVWTKVGDADGWNIREGQSSYLQEIKTVIEALNPDSLNRKDMFDNTGKNNSLKIDPEKFDQRGKKSLATVLDFSEKENMAGRILSERIAAQLYGTKKYDLMGKKEMQELLAALEIKKGEFKASDSSLVWLGSKMDITHLLAMHIGEDELNSENAMQIRMQLSWYDIAQKKKIAESPFQSFKSIQDILVMEDQFIKDLPLPIEIKSNPLQEKKKYSAKPRYEFLNATTLSLAAGALLGFMAVENKLAADRNYEKYQDARSQESADHYKNLVQGKDKWTLIYGSGSGLAVAAGIWGLAFSW